MIKAGFLTRGDRVDLSEWKIIERDCWNIIGLVAREAGYCEYIDEYNGIILRCGRSARNSCVAKCANQAYSG